MLVTFQVLALGGKMGVSIAYCSIYVIFTELMPTVVRNMGLGIFSAAARVGAIICPYVIYIGKCVFHSFCVCVEAEKSKKKLKKCKLVTYILQWL